MIIKKTIFLSYWENSIALGTMESRIQRLVDSLLRAYGGLKNSMLIGPTKYKHKFSLEQLEDMRIIFSSMCIA
jgi:hypothetical protein